MTTFSFTKTMARILKSDATISEVDYANLTAYVSKGEVNVAALCYAGRLKGIGGADGAASLKRLAADLSRTTGALSQWATAYGYLVDGAVPVSDETFTHARRCYNSTKEGRADTVKVLPEIAAAPEAERASMLKAQADKVAAWKREAAAKAKDAPVKGEDSDKNEAPSLVVDLDAGLTPEAFLANLAILANRVERTRGFTPKQVNAAEAHLQVIREALQAAARTPVTAKA